MNSTHFLGGGFTVGLNLKEIKHNNLSMTKSKINIIQNLMFLGAMTESDVLEAVRKWKNKRSTDCNNIDMSLIKQVISLYIISAI